MSIKDIFQAGKIKKENEQLKADNAALKSTLSPEQAEVYNWQNQLDKLKKEYFIKTKELENLQNEKYKTTSEIEQLKKEIVSLNSDLVFQSYALYRPTYEFANSDLYKDELTRIRDLQKAAIKDGKACYGASDWVINGSKSQGNKAVSDTKKLLLRAFNLECDNAVDNVKISNVEKGKEKIYKAAEQISNLGKIMQISITPYYVDLKIKELALALDFQEKKQEEKERIKELKAQQREEEKARKEIEEARKKYYKERAHYQNAYTKILEQIEKSGETAELIEKRDEIKAQLSDNDKAINDLDYREANARAGYVYIISNIGAFGENVYKIGMTRRLDPTERVDELGDASVPFDFDIHALIFSDDAPKLEAALHEAFKDKKLNKINTRREFFNVTLDEIKAEVRKNFDKTVEWIDVPEAEQYRQSLLMR